MSRPRVVPGALLLLAATLALLVAMPAPAGAATCPSHSTPSPYRFAGKVDRVEQDGRLAFVTTSDGKQVEVDGRATTSARQRSFLAGERYEFHPRNARSPFLDDACTQTHELGNPRFSVETFVVLGAIVAMVFSAPRLARWIRRRGEPA